MTVKEKEELADLIAEKVMVKIRTGALREMAWDVFSTLGLEALEEVVNQGHENRKDVGHTNYMNLAEYYQEHLRGIAIENLKQIIAKLTEIHPMPQRKLIK